MGDEKAKGVTYMHKLIHCLGKYSILSLRGKKKFLGPGEYFQIRSSLRYITYIPKSKGNAAMNGSDTTTLHAWRSPDDAVWLPGGTYCSLQLQLLPMFG